MAGIRAVANICAGSSEASVSFLDEPGEHRMLMRRIDSGNVEIQVLWYEDWLSLRPSLQPKNSVLKCTTEKTWVNNPFPMSEYERLGRAAG